MSGMFGQTQKTKSSQTQQGTSQSNIFDTPLGDAYTNYAGSLLTQFNPGNSPPANAYQYAAADNQQGVASPNTLSGFQNAAYNIAQNGLPASSIAPYMQDVQGQVINPMLANFKTLNQQTASDINGNMARSGALSNTNNDASRARLFQPILNQQGQLIGDALQKGYQQASTNAATSLQGQLGGIGAGAQNVGAMTAANTGLGTQGQNIYQTTLMPWNIASQGATAFGNIFGQNPFGTNFSGSGTSQGTTTTSPGWGNTAAALGGTLLSAFSDERLKDNIRRVGETDDGLPIYAFNYKPETGAPPVTQLGLLSSDVKERKPEAVGSSQGFDTVNYDMATEDAEMDRPRKASGGSAGGVVGFPEKVGMAYEALQKMRSGGRANRDAGGSIFGDLFSGFSAAKAGDALKGLSGFGLPQQGQGQGQNNDPTGLIAALQALQARQQQPTPPRNDPGATLTAGPGPMGAWQPPYASGGLVGYDEGGEVWPHYTPPDNREIHIGREENLIPQFEPGAFGDVNRFGAAHYRHMGRPPRGPVDEPHILGPELGYEGGGRDEEIETDTNPVVPFSGPRRQSDMNFGSRGLSGLFAGTSVGFPTPQGGLTASDNLLALGPLAGVTNNSGTNPGPSDESNTFTGPGRLGSRRQDFENDPFMTDRLEQPTPRDPLANPFGEIVSTADVNRRVVSPREAAPIPYRQEAGRPGGNPPPESRIAPWQASWNGNMPNWLPAPLSRGQWIGDPATPEQRFGNALAAMGGPLTGGDRFAASLAGQRDQDMKLAEMLGMTASGHETIAGRASGPAIDLIRAQTAQAETAADPAVQARARAVEQRETLELQRQLELDRMRMIPEIMEEVRRREAGQQGAGGGNNNAGTLPPDSRHRVPPRTPPPEQGVPDALTAPATPPAANRDPSVISDTAERRTVTQADIDRTASTVPSRGGSRSVQGTMANPFIGATAAGRGQYYRDARGNLRQRMGTSISRTGALNDPIIELATP